MTHTVSFLFTSFILTGLSSWVLMPYCVLSVELVSNSAAFTFALTMPSVSLKNCHWHLYSIKWPPDPPVKHLSIKNCNLIMWLFLKLLCIFFVWTVNWKQVLVFSKHKDNQTVLISRCCIRIGDNFFWSGFVYFKFYCSTSHVVWLLITSHFKYVTV